MNQAVTMYGLPFLEKKIGNNEQRIAASPVYQSFEGLPPLCVIASEHEAVFDQIYEMVRRARADNVSCTFGVWKYMCHVFPMLQPFIPEGEESFQFMADWIKVNICANR